MICSILPSKIVKNLKIFLKVSHATVIKCFEQLFSTYNQLFHKKIFIRYKMRKFTRNKLL